MSLYEMKYINFLGIAMKRGDSWERREVKLTDRGQNPTTPIKMWNQCYNLLSTDDEGLTVGLGLSYKKNIK